MRSQEDLTCRLHGLPVILREKALPMLFWETNDGIKHKIKNKKIGEIRMNIAIDGPAGAGKSSIAKLVA